MMRSQVWMALVAALVAVLAAKPAMGQAGGFGGIGGFGGLISGAGYGEQRPDIPSVRPWLNINGVGTRRLRDESIGDAFDYGVSAAGGIAVTKAWARTALAGQYAASGFIINPNDRYWGDGISHNANLQVIHQATQRMSLSLAVMGGSSLGGYGYGSVGAFGSGTPIGIMPSTNPSQGQLSSGNPNIGFQNAANNGIVDNEIYNDRVDYLGVNGGVSYMIDQRNSVSFHAGASGVRRKLDYLADMNSVGGGAGYSRRLNQRANIGLQYSFSQWEYPGLYGGNRTHTLAATVSYTINPRTTFSAYGGAFHYSVNAVGAITLPPQLAALLGTSVVQQIVDYSRNSWVAGATLSRSFRVGSAHVSYHRMPTPGNGLALPSIQEGYSAGYGAGAGRATFGAGAYYGRGQSLARLQADTDNLSVYTTASYRVLGSLHMTGAVSTFATGAATLSNFRTFTASVGLAFSPGTYPLWF